MTEIQILMDLYETMDNFFKGEYHLIHSKHMNNTSAICCFISYTRTLYMCNEFAAPVFFTFVTKQHGPVSFMYAMAST